MSYQSDTTTHVNDMDRKEMHDSDWRLSLMNTINYTVSGK